MSKKLPPPNKTNNTPPNAQPGIEYAINIITLDPKSNAVPWFKAFLIPRGMHIK